MNGLKSLWMPRKRKPKETVYHYPLVVMTYDNPGNRYRAGCGMFMTMLSVIVMVSVAWLVLPGVQRTLLFLSLRDHGIPVDAVVTDMHTTPGARGATRYWIGYQFTWEQESYRDRDQVSITTYHALNIGSEVQVLINPQNPTQSSSAATVNGWFWDTSFIIAVLGTMLVLRIGMEVVQRPNRR